MYNPHTMYNEKHLQKRYYKTARYQSRIETTTSCPIDVLNKTKREKMLNEIKPNWNGSFLMSCRSGFVYFLYSGMHLEENPCATIHNTVAGVCVCALVSVYVC